MGACFSDVNDTQGAVGVHHGSMDRGGYALNNESGRSEAENAAMVVSGAHAFSSWVEIRLSCKDLKRADAFRCVAACSRQAWRKLTEACSSHCSCLASAARVTPWPCSTSRTGSWAAQKSWPHRTVSACPEANHAQRNPRQSCGARADCRLTEVICSHTRRSYLHCAVQGALQL